MKRAALSLLFVACVDHRAPPQPSPDYVADARADLAIDRRALVLGPDLSATERAGTIEAARAWEAATAGDCPVVFMLADAGATGPRVTVTIGALPDPDLIGYASRDGLIVIVPGLSARTFGVTVRHEIGHTLGLDHTPDSAGCIGAMSSGCGLPIQRADVDALCSRTR